MFLGIRALRRVVDHPLLLLRLGLDVLQPGQLRGRDVDGRFEGGHLFQLGLESGEDDVELGDDLRDPDGAGHGLSLIHI